ncbi:hypothetical protein BDR04DRAFT_302026 [Suillus decipiens]|nr:hypothetical protein BDR04DRAFT_302026 [Suillus decipiens]
MRPMRAAMFRIRAPRTLGYRSGIVTIQAISMFSAVREGIPVGMPLPGTTCCKMYIVYLHDYCTYLTRKQSRSDAISQRLGDVF